MFDRSLQYTTDRQTDRQASKTGFVQSPVRVVYFAMAESFQPLAGMLYIRMRKEGEAEQVRGELSEDRLVVVRKDAIYEDIMATHTMTEERRVLLEREDGGLGIAMQGGVDFKVPVKVHKVMENSPASTSGIQDGDVILDVNGTTIWGKTHEEAVSVLRDAGKYVTLRVAKLERKPEGQPEEGQGATQWFSVINIPLALASVTRYHKGTAILRPNTFQVLARDGKTKVSLHCDEQVPGQLHQWITAISERIRDCNRQEVESINTHQQESDQVVVMGWVFEQLPSTAHTKVWKRKFLVLKKMQLHIFSSYPESIQEWIRPEKRYKLLEMTVRVLKAHELPNQRANSILITSGTGDNHILSFENQVDLTYWTKAMHQETMEAVTRLEKQQFIGTWKGQGVYFSVDINHGFEICSRQDMAQLWRKDFHWLTGSSDDGHSVLQMEFALPNSQLRETQEVELEELHVAICTMEAFLTAKLASTDPDFIAEMDLIRQ